MHKPTHSFAKPFFLLLLPLFFVVHGFAAYFPLVPTGEALMVLLTYGVASVALGLLFRLLLRDWTKAALAVVFLLSFEFFFGNLHDGLKKLAPGSLLQKYSFLAPLFLLLFLAWLVYLKRSPWIFTRLARYLNWLLVLLVVVDLGMLSTKAAAKTKVLPAQAVPLVKCDTCAQPDIHLIVADEYPGEEVLQTLFSYDNSVFTTALAQRGFRVLKNTRSNYNWTPYSLASAFHMQYLRLHTRDINMKDLLACEDAIKDSPLFSFLQQQGYALYNQSIFPLNGKPSPLRPVFLSPRRRLITSPTFTERFQKDLGFHFQSPAAQDRTRKHYLHNNLLADSLTRAVTREKKGEKKFIYTHLMLPHHPYYFDSTGKPNPPEALEDDNKLNKKAFLGYLVYSNKKILSLIDHIQQTSAQPPVIILLSDHGFRQLPDSQAQRWSFSNFNAVCLPGQDTSRFYDGMSNVNEFRVLLNTCFGQRLPLVKDSSTFLWEK